MLSRLKDSIKTRITALSERPITAQDYLENDDNESSFSLSVDRAHHTAQIQHRQQQTTAPPPPRRLQENTMATTTTSTYRIPPDRSRRYNLVFGDLNEIRTIQQELDVEQARRRTTLERMRRQGTLERRTELDQLRQALQGHRAPDWERVERMLSRPVPVDTLAFPQDLVHEMSDVTSLVQHELTKLTLEKVRVQRTLDSTNANASAVPRLRRRLDQLQDGIDANRAMLEGLNAFAQVVVQRIEMIATNH